jgi:hypothetical protein
MVPHYVVPVVVPVVVPPKFEKTKQLEDQFKPAVFNKPEYRKPQKMLVVSEDSKYIFDYQNAIRADLTKDVKVVEKKLLKYADREGMKYTIKQELNKIARNLRHRPLKPFLWDNGLALAARDHCQDRLNSDDPTSPIGSDQSTTYDRIRRYGTAGWYRGESIFVREGRIELMAIDGLLDKERRNNVFRPDYHMTGIFSCQDENRKLTVIMYSDSMKLN